MSEELTTIGNLNTDLAPLDTGLDSAAMPVSNLTLVQPVTRDPMNAKPGQLLDALMGDGYDALNVIPLRVLNTRVLFPPGGDTSAPPTCRSSDGLVPSPFAQVKQANKCGYIDSKGTFKPTCPQAMWKRTADGKPIKPPCGERRRVLFYVTSLARPMWFNVSGMGIKAWDLAWKKLKAHRHTMKVVKKVALELYDYWFTLGATKTTNSRGVFYIPRFDLKFVDNPGEYRQIYMDFVTAVSAAENNEELEAVDTGIDSAVDEVVHQAEFVSEV